jgi:hypothetical protein
VLVSWPAAECASVIPRASIHDDCGGVVLFVWWLVLRAIGWFLPLAAGWLDVRVGCDCNPIVVIIVYWLAFELTAVLLSVEAGQ